MDTPDHPKTDGQIESANRVLEEILREYVHSFSSWIGLSPMVEIANNNFLHESTMHTPFYVNGLLPPRIPALIQSDYGLSGEGFARAKTVLFLIITYNAQSDTFDADVDNFDVREEDISSGDDATALPKIGVDAGIFSIVKDCANEEANILA